jgi:hypothetical protein
MTRVSGLEAELRAAGLEHLNSLIGNTTLPVPDALVIGQLDGVWVTFRRDERGVLEERSLMKHPDEEAAVAEFLDKLRNRARLRQMEALLDTDQEPDV